MMVGTCRQSLVLAVQPMPRGFGWTAFAGPFGLHEWGLTYVRNDVNRGSIERIERLIDRLSPETLVLEAYEGPSATRSERVARLGRSLAALAAARNIEVAVYTRGDVRACFATVGARTRQEIAEAVARNHPELRSRLPQARKAWQCEDRRMALFAAAALIATHYRAGAETLFDELRGAA